MSMFPLDDRYRNDATFATLVDRMGVLLHQCEEDGIADPSELRTALTYACVRREMRRATVYVYDAKTGELRRS